MKTKPQIPRLHHPACTMAAATAQPPCALPVLIDTLRAHGYKIVPVSELMGKTRPRSCRRSRRSSAGRRASIPSPSPSFAFFDHFIVVVFFVGDVLMSARLILIGICSPSSTACASATTTRIAGVSAPRVAVLIPAYNEEKVIVRTIRSVLMSDYKNLRIIVIDDGSNDRTFEVAREAYRRRNRSGPPARCSPSPTPARPRR